jgi:beta-lactamase family protein
MEDMKVTASGYDFGPAHAAMRRFVDGNILSGVSSAILVGRDLVDVNCVGWADKEAQSSLRTDHIFRVFSNTKLITSCAALLLSKKVASNSMIPLKSLFHSLRTAAFCMPAPHRWTTPSRPNDRSPFAI